MKKLRTSRLRRSINKNKPIYCQITEYLDWCENVKRMSKQTMNGRRWFSIRLIKDLPINDITELSNKQVNNWIAEQTARGCCGRTINTNIARLRSMIRWFQDMGYTFPNLQLRMIVKCKEEPPRRVYYTRDQIEHVLRYADQEEWLLIKLCFDCGLRISELTRLRLANLNGRMVKFIGKGSKARESYMSEETYKRLQDWIMRKRITDYLWANPNGKHLSVDEIRHLLRQPFYAAGYTNFYPHALRHSFATDVVNNGAPIEIAKEMLGHSNIETTQRYVHSLEGQLQQFFDKYKYIKA